MAFIYIEDSLWMGMHACGVITKQHYSIYGNSKKLSGKLALLSFATLWSLCNFEG